MADVIEELRKKIRVAPVNTDEFSIAVTYHDPRKAQAINRELIARLAEEADRSRRDAAQTEDPADGRSSGPDSDPASGEGGLRTAIDGLDGKEAGQLLLRRFALGTALVTAASSGGSPRRTPERAEPRDERMPRFQVVIPPDLPDTPVSPSRSAVTLVGVAAGLCVGLLTRPRSDAH